MTHQNISFPICTSFRPTFLEGQLCYKLDLNSYSGQGKKNELLLLLDYNADLSLQPKTDSSDIDSESFYLNSINSGQSEAKIQINTLSVKMMNFGGGTYKMTDVKRITAKPDFLKMSLKDRKCEVEEYEDCRTRKLLKTCGCAPQELAGYQASSNPSSSRFAIYLTPIALGSFGCFRATEIAIQREGAVLRAMPILISTAVLPAKGSLLISSGRRMTH